MSQSKPFRIYDGGQAIQHLGLDYETGKKLGSLDGILAERPELVDGFMAHPLPQGNRI